MTIPVFTHDLVLTRISSTIIASVRGTISSSRFRTRSSASYCPLQAMAYPSGIWIREARVAAMRS